MILVDTSIWVDHLRKGDLAMQGLLDRANVLCHPLIIGELAMGELNPREAILRMLRQFPVATIADEDEVLRFVSYNKLYAVGIGYIDAHLLASVRLTPGATLWTRDKRLARAAESLNLAFMP
jgi:predicted nucleic acid-binding protein